LKRYSRTCGSYHDFIDSVAVSKEDTEPRVYSG
jgi:hypothetical protein